MSLHLANILSLIACLALTAWWSSNKPRWTWRGQGKLGAMWAATYIGVVVLAITGALSALGDTLYPAESLLQGVMQDFGGEAATLLRTRPLHPLVATVVALWTLWTILTTIHLRPGGDVARVAPLVLVFLAGQYVFGWWNLLALAPAWAQLTHLLLAMLLWIGLLCLGSAALSRREEVAEDGVLSRATNLESQTVENPGRDGGESEEVRGWSNQAPSVS
jgi:heme A synthase